MKTNAIFLSPVARCSDELGGADIIQQDIAWCCENSDSPHVLCIDLETSLLLQRDQQFFEIISDETDSMMISVGMEDDWIFDNEIKLSVKKKLESLNYSDKKLLSVTDEIINLLDIAISENKGIYFYFSHVC